MDYVYRIYIGDEMFSDTYPMKLVSDCLYEVTGKVNKIIIIVHTMGVSIEIRLVYESRWWTTSISYLF